MEILSLEENSRALLERIAAILKIGGVITGPTDTVYGLFCDAMNEKAVRRMFLIKKRPEEKAFPVFVKDIAEARKFAYISDAKARFLEKIWPGQVTIIFEHKGKLPHVLTGGKHTIGIRVPDNAFLLALMERAQVPLAQTSANIAGKPPAKNVNEIQAYFQKETNKPDLTIDTGEISGSPSTIIDFVGNNPLIVRAGVMTKRELDEIIKTPFS